MLSQRPAPLFRLGMSLNYTRGTKEWIRGNEALQRRTSLINASRFPSVSLKKAIQRS